MNKDNKILFGTGCQPSVMDGTEHKFIIEDEIELPDEFSWQDVMPPVKNQGSTYTCVCQSLTGVMDFLHNSNIGVSGVCNGFDVDELYNARTNKPQEGMSFKEALHYLRHNGLKGEKIDSYAMIEDNQSIKNALVMFGPVVTGLPVYSGNMTRKFWIKRGFYQGGHAVTLVGYTKDGFIIRNSWGSQWADKGHVVIPYDEFDMFVFETWTITL